MTDGNKQEIMPPPNGTRLPAAPPPRPSLPSMPTGGGVALTQIGQLRKDGQYLTLYSAKLRALADNAVAMRELVEKRDALAMAIANLHSLQERCAHQYEMGRLSRHNELELARLNAEHDQLQAKIRNAAAQMELARHLPIPVCEEPPVTVSAPPPPAPPVGLSPSEIEEVVRASLPEITPETLRTLCLLLQGRLAEKRS